MGFHYDWSEFKQALKDSPSYVRPFKVLNWSLGCLAERLQNYGWYQFLRVFEVVAIIVAVVAFWVDMQDREEERTARMWQLATSPVKGNSGKIPALEFLIRKGHPLSGINIPEAYLWKAQLPGANLQDANLSKATLIEANLSGAYLSDANLIGANLIGAKLNGAKLSGAKLGGAKLGGANLSMANLMEADLTGADLIGANLRRADLFGVNLNGANLTGANLTGAYLTWANLGGASLMTAENLTQKQLDTACISKDGYEPILPDGLTAPKNICPEE